MAKISRYVKDDLNGTTTSSARIGITLLLQLALLTRIVLFAMNLYLPAS
jgi:hypothetical protein